MPLFRSPAPDRTSPQIISPVNPTPTTKSVTHSGARTSKLRLADRDRAAFLRHFATALEAQLPLITSLRIISQQSRHPGIKRLATELTQVVSSGKPLSYGFAQFNRIFTQLDVSLIGVGETSGRLDHALADLADLAERELELRRETITAAMYPLFVLGLGLVSVVIVVTYILPRILATLATDISTLPWATRTLLACSNFLKSPTGITAVGSVIVAAVIVSRWKTTARGRYFFDSLMLRLPVVGPMQYKRAMSRFAYHLGTVTKSGINILDALKVVRNTLRNEALARQLDGVGASVRAGASVSDALRHTGQFPPMLVQIVAVGEQTGRLADLLLNAATAFDRDTQVAVKRFVAIFPAVLVTLLALVVGFIVAATLLPIVQLETAIPGL